jgi:Protein of unknown function (DUF2795)
MRMQRSSDRHGPRIDEDLDRLTQSVTRGAPVESRAEEEREQEGPADDEPVAQAVIHGPGEDFELRSEIARHLEPSVLPASRDQLIRTARHEQAPAGVLRWLERLPDGLYPTIESVWEALGGHRERR